MLAYDLRLKWALLFVTVEVTKVGIQSYFRRTQYPLIKEYTLNYRGLNIMI